jgi:hypothetical protein
LATVRRRVAPGLEDWAAGAPEVKREAAHNTREPMMMSRLSLIAVLAATLLAGCTTAAKQAACPGTAVLVDAARQTIFRQGATPDPGNVLYTVQIVGVTSTCDIAKNEHKADTSLEITFRAARAPNGDAPQYTVPYFVAVTQADRIVNKQSFSAQFTFAPGQAAVDFTDTVSSTVVHADEGKHPYDYQILIGLPLTKEQLDYNRTFGRFTQ